MRDFALTQDLLALALKNTESKRIVRVNLLIGPFSGEREEPIRLFWKDLAKGSRGEGARLRFDHMPVVWKCLDCSGAFYLDEGASMCTFCSKEERQLRGDDVRITSIEVE